MKNPFVAMATAALAAQQMLRSKIFAAFSRGEILADIQRPTSYARKTGLTVAAAKRMAKKEKNRRRHRLACRGRT